MQADERALVTSTIVPATESCPEQESHAGRGHRRRNSHFVAVSEVTELTPSKAVSEPSRDQLSLDSCMAESTASVNFTGNHQDSWDLMKNLPEPDFDDSDLDSERAITTLNQNFHKFFCARRMSEY